MEKGLFPDKLKGGDDEFQSLMEQSLNAPRQGDVLSGRVLLITRDAGDGDSRRKSHTGRCSDDFA